MASLALHTGQDTFVLETSHLVLQDAWLHAGVNILLQNAIGLCSLAVGLTLGRFV